MNILVTGANGQLGNEMRLVAAGTDDHYLFTDVAELDITDAEAVLRLVRKESIDVVVNCAAYTNVDQAEDDAERCELLNATAVRNLAEAVKAVDGWLIHISTDYVFGAEPYNTPCREDQKGTPTGVYGLTKLHGEQHIAAVGCKHLIVRTAWLYSEFGRNFVKTMLRLTAEKPMLKVVYDQCGTPTYAYDLAAAITHIISHRLLDGHGGTYHYSNEGVCSWYDFTHMIAEYAGHRNCDIRPCRSDEFPSKVKRPAYSVLDKTKFKEAFSLSVPYWTDSLKVCLRRLREMDELPPNQ